MRRGHIVAGIGALLLLLIMAMDWYSTAQGDEARRLESITSGNNGAESGEIDRAVNEDARSVGEREEKNAWQEDGVIDRVILGLMLAAIAMAILTWFTRAAGAKPTEGVGPAGLAAILATLAACGVAYRIIQEPGLDQATHVKAGAVLALIPLGMIALGMSSALRADEKEAGDARAA